MPEGKPHDYHGDHSWVRDTTGKSRCRRCSAIDVPLDVLRTDRSSSMTLLRPTGHLSACARLPLQADRLPADAAAPARGAPAEVAILAASMARNVHHDGGVPPIDAWRSYPYKKRAPRKGAEPGYYYLPSEDERVEGRFIVVVENKAKTGTYAKVLTQQVSIDVTRWAWEYQKGLAFQVADRDAAHHRAGQGLGKLHGHCIICARRLHRPCVGGGSRWPCVREARSGLNQAPHQKPHTERNTDP